MTSDNGGVKLRECPFCKGEAELLKKCVGCADCGALGSAWDEQEQAINAWNTRPSPSPVDNAGEVAEAASELVGFIDDHMPILSGNAIVDRLRAALQQEQK